MKKVVRFILLLVTLLPINVFAQRGCCSHHGGVSGACRNGKQVCNDGTTSPSCTCSGGTSTSSSKVYTPSYIYGCTNRNAINYNPSANKDDGSCIAKVLGCTDKNAKNYNPSANTSDGTCQYEKENTETKVIKYSSKKINNDEIMDGITKVTTRGENGEKQITYVITLDANGKEISREKKSEIITKKPVTQIIEVGTKTTNNQTLLFLWIICLSIAFYQAFKHKEGNLLLNKIQKQRNSVSILLYILYILTVLPAFIDVIKIIVNKCRKK